MKYTFTQPYFAAHNLSGTATVYLPDEVAENQKDFDGKTFPIIKASGKRGRGKLMGDAYGLHTSGTGDAIVKVVG